jgi:hypothetical protein
MQRHSNIYQSAACLIPNQKEVIEFIREIVKVGNNLRRCDLKRKLDQISEIWDKMLLASQRVGLWYQTKMQSNYLEP